MSIIHDALKKVENERAQGSSKETQAPPPPLYLPDPPLTIGYKPSAPGNTTLLSRYLPSIYFGKNLLGVDMGSSSIKVVRLTRKGGTCYITGVGYARLPSGISKSGVTEALKNVMKAQKIVNGRVASSIGNKSLTFSYIRLPKMPDDDLREAVVWEVKKGINFPDDAVIDFVVNGEVTVDNKVMLSILAFAVKREDVLEHVEILKKAVLASYAVDTCSMALLSAFDYNYGWEDNKRYAVIDIGASKSTLSIICNESLRFTRYISLAGNDITRSIQDAERIDFDVAEEKKLHYAAQNDNAPEAVRQAVKYFMEGMTMEIRRSFNYYQAQLREGLVEGILISGGCAKIKGLTTYIENNIGVPTAVYDTLKGVKITEDIQGGVDLPYLSPFLAEAFGLALRREGE